MGNACSHATQNPPFSFLVFVNLMTKLYEAKFLPVFIWARSFQLRHKETTCIMSENICSKLKTTPCCQRETHRGGQTEQKGCREC